MKPRDSRPLDRLSRWTVDKNTLFLEFLLKRGCAVSKSAGHLLNDMSWAPRMFSISIRSVASFPALRTSSFTIVFAGRGPAGWIGNMKASHISKFDGVVVTHVASESL